MTKNKHFSIRLF